MPERLMLGEDKALSGVTHTSGPLLNSVFLPAVEGIPDSQEDVTDERVGKDHEEPVERDEREVYMALSQNHDGPPCASQSGLQCCW